MKIGKIIAGIGGLILVFLLLNNAGQTTGIIKTIAENSIAGVKVLQGRG